MKRKFKKVNSLAPSVETYVCSSCSCGCSCTGCGICNTPQAASAAATQNSKSNGTGNLTHATHNNTVV